MWFFHFISFPFISFHLIKGLSKTLIAANIRSWITTIVYDTIQTSIVKYINKKNVYRKLITTHTITTKADKPSKHPSQSTPTHPPKHDHIHTLSSTQTTITAKTYKINSESGQFKGKNINQLKDVIIRQSCHVQQWAVLVTHSFEFWQSKFILSSCHSTMYGASPTWHPTIEALRLK